MLRRRLSIIARRTDLTRRQFSVHCFGPHVTAVRTLPGLRVYIQHHVVDNPSPSPPIDGISEVLFESPATQPPNTHFIESLMRDELQFVSSSTQMPVRNVDVSFSNYSVWMISRDADSTPDALPGFVQINLRDTDQPVMSRSFLGTEAHPPLQLVRLGHDRWNEAAAAYSVVRSRLSHADRTLLTRSWRVI